MRQGNLPREIQPYPRPTRLRREERHEHLVTVTFRNAAAIVRYLDGCRAFCDAAGNVDAGIVHPGNRIAGVAQQIDDRLLEQLGIGGQRRGMGLHRAVTNNPPRRIRRGQQLLDITEQLIQTDTLQAGDGSSATTR